MLRSASPRGAALALCAAAWVCPAAATPLTQQEQAGARIYLQGESPSGARIAARIGMGGLELAGASVACGNCHGEDGRGRVEGGVEPSNIQWSELTKVYGHHHPNGRRHGAFDEPLLRRAVMEGIDPDANRLDAAMPRFSMSAKDFAALAAYLRRLEWLLDPGLSSDTIRIGTLLPLSGPLAGLGESLRALWSAYFAALNQRGGIHGRRLELVVEQLPADIAQARARVRDWLAEGSVFAVLAPVSAGIEGELADAASVAQVPVIGPLTLFPEDPRASNSFVFHAQAGVAELAQVLALHASKELNLAQRPIALWHTDSPDGKATAKTVEAALSRAGWVDPFSVPIAAHTSPHDALAAALKARIGWTPHLLVPGPLAPRNIVELPVAFRDRVILAYPTSPGDQRSDAMREYSALLQGRAESRLYQPQQIGAYSAGLLLIEALKRTGRDLSRRKLIATLETVQGFETGLTPPMSYNADRRIGTMGGYLVAVDLERKGLRPMGGYVRLP
jgi:cytochrome c553